MIIVIGEKHVTAEEYESSLVPMKLDDLLTLAESEIEKIDDMYNNFDSAELIDAIIKFHYTLNFIKRRDNRKLFEQKQIEYDEKTMKVTSFDQEPLKSLLSKYGIPYKNGETFVLGVESAEEEGDLVVTDLVEEDKYPNEVIALNKDKYLGTYDEILDDVDVEELPDEFFKDRLAEKNIDRDDISCVMAFIIFDEKFSEAYFIGYQLQGSFGICPLSYKIG